MVVGDSAAQVWAVPERSYDVGAELLRRFRLSHKAPATLPHQSLSTLILPDTGHSIFFLPSPCKPSVRNVSQALCRLRDTHAHDCSA